jgi:hypothetical protein
VRRLAAGTAFARLDSEATQETHLESSGDSYLSECVTVVVVRESEERKESEMPGGSSSFEEEATLPQGVTMGALKQSAESERLEISSSHPRGALGESPHR